MTTTEQAELINLRQTVSNHECALKAMDAVNAKLRAELERSRARLNEMKAVAAEAITALQNAAGL